MTTIAISEARPQLHFLMNKAAKDREIFTITDNDIKAVMMSETEYRSLLETLRIYAQPEYAAELRRRIADADAGVNMVEHELIEVSDET